MTNVQAQEEAELKELQELQNQIRRDKFDQIFPQIMREYDIDMWIHVARASSPNPFSAEELGSTSGVFIFTDRGGDRIERAVLGIRWKQGPAISGRRSNSDHKVVEESGAYDIIGESTFRREMPGSPESQYDLRFKGIGEFVAERDPRRIAVNYMDELGPPLDDSEWNDDISHTDYNLLVKALGDTYAGRLVSSEYLIYEYLSRPVPSEIALHTIIRQGIEKAFERDFDKIVPGVTKIGDLEGNVYIMEPERDRKNDDYVIQRGDLFIIDHGLQQGYMNSDWKYGNFYEGSIETGYVLREGEIEPPQKLKEAWADHLKIRKVLEDNIKVGRTAGETYEILKQKLAEAGIIANDRQLYYKDLDPKKTQVAIDNHALGKGVLAPRIGPFGPDWMRDLTIPPNHHFVMEYFTYTALPHTKMQSKYINLWLHDGAIVTESGVEYLSPPPTELHLIR